MWVCSHQYACTDATSLIVIYSQPYFFIIYLIVCSPSHPPSPFPGGQKSRVSFAVISWKKPHVLVLDEPTNHLDIETIDAVIVALGNFSGGVICVSHDAHFIESIADEIWVLGGGRVKRFNGTFNDYRQVALGEKAERD